MESHGAVRLAGLVIGLWLQGRSEPEAARPVRATALRNPGYDWRGFFPISLCGFFLFLLSPSNSFLPSLTHSLAASLTPSVSLPQSVK